MSLTQKQETFCLNVFEGMSQREAYSKAGYSTNMTPAVIAVKASQLAANGKVMARLAELRQKAEDASVMSVLERKQRLSEIARARMADFVTAGPDGSWVNIGIEGCQSAALQSVKSSTEYDENGDKPTVITDIKLHDPMKAIDVLNKMDRIYDSERGPIINNNLVMPVQTIAIDPIILAKALKALAESGVVIDAALPLSTD